MTSLQRTKHGFVSTKCHRIGAIWQSYQDNGGLPEQLPVYLVGAYQRLFRGRFWSSPFGSAIILQTNATCAENVKPTNEAIKELLINAHVVNFDETGLRVEGTLNWLHVASTPNLTYYSVHPKRGKDAMDAIGILSEFEGVAVHDHLSPYFNYTDIIHGLCNAHHLRDLTFVHEQYKQGWAEDMIQCLLDIKKDVDQARLCKDEFDFDKIEEFEVRYDKIIVKGLELNPPPSKES